MFQLQNLDMPIVVKKKKILTLLIPDFLQNAFLSQFVTDKHHDPFTPVHSNLQENMFTTQKPRIEIK